MRRRAITIDGNRTFQVESVKASRAVYFDQDRQEVEVEVIVEGGIKIRLRFPARDAHALLDQVGVAYQAIMPPPITGLSNYGARVGMWD